MTKYSNAVQAEQAAYNHYNDCKPTDTDLKLALAFADHYIASAYGRKIHLSIFHDMRKLSTEGPCPLPYDWQHKNVVGISTTDAERARDWCVKALLLGYSVARSFRRGCGGGGNGSPGTYESASTRAKARESTGANAPVEKRVGKDGRRRRRRPYYESWPKAEQARRLQEATGVLARSPS